MKRKKSFGVDEVLLVLNEVLTMLYCNYSSNLPTDIKNTLKKLISKIVKILDDEYPDEDAIKDTLIRQVTYNKTK